ncbi:MAG: ATPase, T2SS/T4P/T4SS family [Myxococcota bacterium]
MKRQRLGEMLLQSGLITPEKLELALNVQRRTHERLGFIIERLGFISPDDIARTVATQYGIPFVDLQGLRLVEVDKDAIDKLSLDFCKRHTVLPVLKKGKPFLISEDILNTHGNDRALQLIGRRPIVLSTSNAISTLLETVAFGGVDGERIVESTRGQISKGELNEFLGWLLGRAVLAGASDIHVEPAGPVSVIRFRVDGVLQPEISLPRERHDNLVNVLFGRSGIDLSDFQRLRDGRFSFKFAGRTLDVRFASSPTVEGPMVVMRILADTRSITKLDKLGHVDWNLRGMRELVRHPFGVILMVGPTGSGKTTTLYSLLASLNDTQKKILTVEDPVEIKLPSIQQIQCNEKAGVTFAKTIRGFLRQDPDIILVGEIRDEETAREAFRAANTGHLVLSTLHANSAVEAVARLVDLGLEPYRVADTMIGVIAQRLIRILCPKCSVPAPVGRFRGVREPSPDGCEHCHGKGFVGRRVVAEVLQFTDPFRLLVHAMKPATEMVAHAKSAGFKPMLDNGRYLVTEGQTSIAECERVVGIVDLEAEEESAASFRSVSG